MYSRTLAQGAILALVVGDSDLTTWMREDGESEMETPRKVREALTAHGLDPHETELLDCFDDNDDPWLVYSRVKSAGGTEYDFYHYAETGEVISWRRRG